MCVDKWGRSLKRTTVNNFQLVLRALASPSCFITASHLCLPPASSFVSLSSSPELTHWTSVTLHTHESTFNRQSSWHCLFYTSLSTFPFIQERQEEKEKKKALCWFPFVSGSSLCVWTASCSMFLFCFVFPGAKERNVAPQLTDFEIPTSFWYELKSLTETLMENVNCKSSTLILIILLAIIKKNVNIASVSCLFPCVNRKCVARCLNSLIS